MWMGRWERRKPLRAATKHQTSNFEEAPKPLQAAAKLQTEAHRMESEEMSLDLLERPVCGADELGKPIPDSTHAVSVALPRWADVIGYEEKKSEVIDRLQSGCPR